MAYGILMILCALAVGYLVLRRKTEKEPRDTYVCDVCGEKDCLCHKLEKR